MAVKTRQSVILTEEERQQIAKIVHKERQANPNGRWIDVIDKARQSLPTGRRFADTYTAPHQFTWLPRYLEVLSKNQVPNKDVGIEGSRIRYTNEEKQNIALAYYKIRQQNPNMTSVHILSQVRDILPEHRKFNKQMHSIHQLSWLPTAIEAIEKYAIQAPLLQKPQEKELKETRPPIDSRQKLQTQIDPPVVKQAKKRKEKVFLDHDEKMLFAEQVYLLRKQFGNMEWRYILRKANEVLPEDRRVGQVPSQGAIKWLEEYLGRVERQITEETARPEPAPAQAAPVAPAPAANPFADMMAQMMKDAVEKAVAGAMAQAVTTIAAPVIPTHQETIKKKVLVVGLQPMQGHEIQREFGRAFDFKIFDSNVSADKIKSNLKGHDYAVLMTKFVSHSTQAAMRGHPGFTFCNGTVQALKDTLANWVGK